MKRPTSVRIGHFTWSIEWLSKEDWEARDNLSEGNAGETHAADQSIFVVLAHPSGDLNEDYLRMILLHEMLHACMEITNASYTILRMKKDDIEEAVVGALSGPLLAVLWDNPSVRQYLLDR